MTKRIQIVVPTKDGFESVLAFSTDNPNLAIHKSLSDSPELLRIFDAWTLTHIPSGFAVITTLPGRYAAEMASVWALKSPVDWGLATKESIVASSPACFGEHLSVIKDLCDACADCIGSVFDALGYDRAVVIAELARA